MAAGEKAVDLSPYLGTQVAGEAIEALPAIVARPSSCAPLSILIAQHRDPLLTSYRGVMLRRRSLLPMWSSCRPRRLYA